MSNIISTNSIVSDILSGLIKLENIKLEDFLKDRLIYPSHKEAYCKGYEAHHIVPIYLQLSLYNQEHPNNKLKRYNFIKQVPFDDRCVRLTPFEHIIAHYLLAKESNSPEALYALQYMTHKTFSKLEDVERDILSNNFNFISIRDRGRFCPNKGRTMKEITGNPMYKDSKIGRKRYNNGIKEIVVFPGEEPKGYKLGSLQKGKSLQEKMKNPNYVDKKRGRKASEIYKEGWVHPNLGKHVYNNGVREIRALECPIGFVPGCIPNSHKKTPEQLEQCRIRGEKIKEEFRLGIRHPTLHTEESKLKMSKSRKGRKLSQSAKDHLREINLGKKCKKEVKDKISKSVKLKSLEYKKAKELGEFLGTWNEWQSLHRV